MSWGFPVGASGKESTCQCRRHKRGRFDPWIDQEDPLEKEMATHSRILAWNTPLMEEPGRLQSMGCKESGMIEQLSMHTHTHTHTHNAVSQENKVAGCIQP